MTEHENRINYSELASLASCERKWWYGYNSTYEESPDNKRGLYLGTLLHLFHDRWMNRELTAGELFLPQSWTDDINTGGKPGDVRTLTIEDFPDDVISDAHWLMDRWVKHYGMEPPSDWEIIATEEWLTADIGNGVELVGRHDGLFRVNGDLWLNEVKSYKSKGRLDSIQVEPQPATYVKLVEANYGETIVGIMYDGIYTYHWKPELPTQKALIESAIASGDDQWLLGATKKAQTEWARARLAEHPGIERPVEESFDRRWTDRTPLQITRDMAVYQSAVNHRDYLKALPLDSTLPNVGMACNMCGFKDRCWSYLAGSEEDEREIELA